MNISMGIRLMNRGIIEINGLEARKFLQGLVTSDLYHLKSLKSSQPTAFLNSKGRIICDGILTMLTDESFLLDCPQSSLAQVLKHMKLYKLRSKVFIEDRSEALKVMVAGATYPWNVHPDISSITLEVGAICGVLTASTDPRSSCFGVRAIVPKDVALNSLECCPEISMESFETLRFMHGIAEGRELTDRTPLECNLDLLNYVSFAKGCYLGQELTARTHFKGVVRKRIMPFLISSDESFGKNRLHSSSELSPGTVSLNSTPHGVQPGMNIVNESGTSIGEIISVGAHNVGLAIMRLEHVLCKEYSMSYTEVGSHRVLPLTPPWWPEKIDLSTGKVS